MFKLIFDIIKEYIMKKYDLRNTCYDMIDEIHNEIIEQGYGHILTFDIIEDRLWSSLIFDADNSSLWCDDVEDILRFAVGIGYIEEDEFEDYLSKKHFGVTLK